MSYTSPAPRPHPQNRSLAEQLSGAFILFGALVSVASFVTALGYGIGSLWLTPEFDRSRMAVEAERAAFAAMLDEEDGLRAYLLTREIGFLGPYTRAELALARANEALTANAGSVSDLAGAMLATRLAEETWRERWAKIAADVRPGAALPSMSEGKALFDAYRSEEALFADSLVRRSDSLSRREQRLIATRVVLELGVFMAVLFFAMRQHNALRAAIVDPVAALLRHIGRIRDGHLDATVDPGGPPELRGLGEGLNDMVRALAMARESAETRNEAIRDHSVRLRKILDASREFSESLNLRYVLGAVRGSTAAVGGYDHVIVWLMDDEQKRLVNTDHVEITSDADAPVEMGQGLAGRAAKAGRITFEDAVGHVGFNDKVLSVRAIAIPLIVGARVVGVLEARHTEARPSTMHTIEILEMLAAHAATAIESARLHEITEERSQMDPLTRLYNRRRLEEDLDGECKRCIRYGRPLAFVMLDVDHFKAFNDAHGHPQADTALQEVAGVIGGCVRTTDTAYRYGGEEFCVLLRETSGKDAMIFAERLRQRIEQRFSSGAATGLTASFGVAEFSAATPMPRELIEAADAAMYQSKHEGRNRVMLSSPPAFGLVPNGEVEPLLS